MRFSTDCDNLADRQIVIEAVIENEDEKTSVFGRLDKVVDDPWAILASNTSSIPIMKNKRKTSGSFSMRRGNMRTTQVVGIHFFIPVPVLTLVERRPGRRHPQLVRGRAGSPGRRGRRAKRPPHHFKRPEKLVGPDGGELKKIQKLGESLAVTEYFKWLGPLRGKEKHEAFECCEFLALPSDEDPYPLALLEAMAHQKAVLATSVVGPASVIGAQEAGIIVSPGRSGRDHGRSGQVVDGRAISEGHWC